MRALKLTAYSNASVLDAGIVSGIYMNLRSSEERLDTARRIERAAKRHIPFLRELTIKLVKSCQAWGGNIVLCLQEDHVVTSYGEMYKPLSLTPGELYRLFSGKAVWFDDFYCQPIFIGNHLVAYFTLHIQNYRCTNQVQSLVEAYCLLIQKDLEPMASRRTDPGKRQGQYDLFNEEENKAYSLSKLISIATHDLNSLISAIGGYLRLSDRLLEDARNFGKVKQYNRQIARGIEDIHDILKQLHDLSRFEQEDKDLYSTTLDVSWLAREVGDLLQSLAWEKNQRVHLSIPDAPQYAVGNVVMIKRIVTNLISNAVKYTKEGGSISVSVRTKSDSVVVSVADNGMGIPEDKLDSIFKPFTRLGKPDRGGEHTMSSLGLGLFLSHKFAKLMDGEITVSSKIGEGSVFSFYLPRPSQRKLSAVNAEWLVDSHIDYASS